MVRGTSTKATSSPAAEDIALTKKQLCDEIARLQTVIRSHEVCIEDDRESLGDYAGILKRELAYHKLRVEEITRDLRHNCIEV